MNDLLTNETPASGLRNATAEEAAIAAALLTKATYQDIADAHGCSRGKVYGVALKFGLRKYERRIHQRKQERQREQFQAFKEMMGSTVTADVLQFLDMLPDECVHLHLASPPYNVGKRYSGGVSADCMRHGMYLGWQMQIIDEIARTLKPGGTVVYQVGLTINERTGERFPLDELLAPMFRMVGLTYQNRIVWPVQNGLTPKGRLAERYETALVFSKGPTPTFNANAIRIAQKHPAKRYFRGPRQGELSGHPLGAWPIDVWGDIIHLMHNHPDKTEHPAGFPIAFPKRAIMAYTMPEDVVCDMFNGAGTTQIAAQRTGRAFIGCDIGYADLRERRLLEEDQQRLGRAERGELDDYTFCQFTGVTDESMRIRAEELGARAIVATPVTDDEEEANLLSLFARAS